MSAYLKKNKPMIQLMLNLCEKNQIEMPMLFNEGHYRCLRMQYDGNAGVGLRKHSLLDVHSWPQSELTSALGFLMAWALFKKRIYPDPDPKDKTITKESKEGKTVYVIQNLNINITAEVVHQLNMNPQEVINHYHELIQREIEKKH